MENEVENQESIQPELLETETETNVEVKGEVEENIEQEPETIVQEKTTPFKEWFEKGKAWYIAHEKEIQKGLHIAVFVLYCWILAWIIALKCNDEVVITDAEFHEGMSLWQRMEYSKGYIPLRSLFVSLDNPVEIISHLLNVIIYLPMGAYLWIFFKDTKKTLLVVALTTIAFELIQLITGLGGFDSTDLVTNFLGGWLGYLFYTKVPIKNKEKWLTIVNACMLIIFLPVGIYTFVNTIQTIPLYMTLID